MPGKSPLRIQHLIALSLAMYILLLVVPLFAAEIVVVQTSHAIVYEKGYEGLLQTIRPTPSNWGQKSIAPDTHSRIVLSEISPDTKINEKLQRLNPDVIVAIGRRALLQVMTMPDTPIIHLLVPFPPKDVQNNPNIVGIDLNLSPEKQLAAFVEIFPTIKRIGVVYNPAESGAFIKQAEHFANLKKITLLSRKAQNDREAIQHVMLMEGGIDAVWMLPERSISTPIFIDAMIRFSIENRIPLLTFADKYLQKGATLALSADPFAMGKKAGLLTRQRLNHSPLDLEDEAHYAETAVINLNEKIARKIGLMTNTAALTPPSESVDR